MCVFVYSCMIDCKCFVTFIELLESLGWGDLTEFFIENNLVFNDFWGDSEVFNELFINN